MFLDYINSNTFNSNKLKFKWIIMKEELILKSEESEQENREYNYFQIDFLKTVMIFLVIYDHIVYWDIKRLIGVALWERISIPVFLVIMGFNLGNSFRRSGAKTLRELYSRQYLKKKVLRYIIPFLVLYLVSTITGWILYNFNIIEMYNTQTYPTWGIINLFTGILPFWGPGNWFIPVILQSILIAPLIYYGFTKKPKLTLILTFIIEIALQLIVFFFIGEITSWEELHILNLFMTSVLFYLSGIGLGFWFSQDHKLQSKHNFFMWILFPLSLAYLVGYQFFGFRIRIDGLPLLRGDYHFLVFPYSAFLVLLALRYLPNNPEGRLAKNISTIGKSTYHILLIQILALGMMVPFWGTHYAISNGFNISEILDLLVPWALTIPVGVKWYKIDQIKNLRERILYTAFLFVAYVALIILLYSFASSV